MARGTHRRGRGGHSPSRALRRRLLLVLVLLVVAIILVVGTQNFDERASVHLLLWSFDMPLLLFFIASISLGILAGELIRYVGRRRRPKPPPPGAP